MVDGTVEDETDSERHDAVPVHCDRVLSMLAENKHKILGAIAVAKNELAPTTAIGVVVDKDRDLCTESSTRVAHKRNRLVVFKRHRRP